MCKTQPVTYHGNRISLILLAAFSAISAISAISVGNVVGGQGRGRRWVSKARKVRNVKDPEMNINYFRKRGNVTFLLRLTPFYIPRDPLRSFTMICDPGRFHVSSLSRSFHGSFSHFPTL